MGELYDIYSKIGAYLDDDILERMESNLVPSGRGRPMKLPDLQPTNRVLLQLGLLKRRHQTVTWERLSTFASELFALQFGEGFPALSSVIGRVQQEVATANMGADELEEFLHAFRDLKFVKGNYCKKCGVTVDMLMGISTASVIEPMMNGLVIELEQYRKLHSFKDLVFQEWLVQFCPQLHQYSKNQIRKKVDALMKKHKDKVKDVSLHEQTFLDFILSTSRKQTVKDSHYSSQIDLTTADSDSHVSSHTDMTTANTICECQCVTMLNEMKKEKEENRKLRCQIKEVKEEKELLLAENEALKSVTSSLRKELDDLKTALAKTKSDLDTERNETENLKEKLSAKSKLCAAYARNSNNVKRQQEKISSTQNRLTDLSSQVETAEQAVEEKEAALQTIKKELTLQKGRFIKSVRREATLKQKISSLEADLLRLVQLQEEIAQESIQLRTPKGHYTPTVQACVIELMGNEIAASRVGPVIKCVLSHLCSKQNIQLCDLPSKTTCLRFADIGHALSKMQIAEELKSQLFDLHVDGTSRDHRKIVGHQITLQSGKQLALGFCSVDRENTDTLIDVTMTLMHEISFLGTATYQETEDIVKDVFRHMVATMTDRAATMKSFGRKLCEAKKELLSEDAGLEFLFCSAHFLLGLSESTSRALHHFEDRQDWSGKLGRDLTASFSHFKKTSKHPAALRLIRTACDVLGPRGDEKNGCQDDWMAYLSLPMVKKKNTVGSFRANRFNNVFESAAAILHHRQDIVDFFTNFSDKTLNLKQQSVLEDVQDDNIMLMVSALAVMYVCVAGPFWMLINSSIHYLDMYKHVQTLSGHLEHISEDRTALEGVLESLPSTLETFFMEETPPIRSVQDTALCLRQNEPFKDLLQIMCREFLCVIKRQLHDFLPGGKYSQPPTEEQRHRMAHCKLTNLFGEANFGDLDFSLNKRRHSSLHHHSSVIMQKRNETASWLAHKSAEEQQQLLDVAKTAATSLRKRHRENEEEENRKGRERIQKKNEEKIRKDHLQKQRRMDIITAVQKIGGVWVTTAQIRKHVGALRTLHAKRQALRFQIQYHKMVLGAKDPLLIMAKKTVRELTNSLCQYVEQTGPAGPSAEIIVADEPPSKRSRFVPLHLGQSSCTGEPSVTSNRDTAQDSTDNSTKDMQPGHFTQQGEKVAVFYDDRFYVGEVLDVVSPTRATIAFMTSWGDRNAFKWPDAIDCDPIDSKFVLAWNLDMFSTNGRTWCVKEFDAVVEKYREWKSA
ncbi:uncharacterized protein LOC143284579 [Babylonia areolata]|uniref:uncharacterized protein LOC143284579 n=1 Tax=Babylonia areolata TaxID=304850 RepID=UPI003FCF6F47